MTTPPIVLTIAGSDSGGGAGIQADLKTFAAHGVYGLSAVTAVTAQNTCGVTAVEELSPALVGAQIDAVFDDFEIDAVKIGMLSGVEIIESVAAGLERWRPRYVVLDPVMVATSGDALLRDDAVVALHEQLLPLATVVTPNLPEAERLSGRSVASEAARLAAARNLLTAIGESADRRAGVLIKGGHDSGPEVRDLLVSNTDSGKESVQSFVHPRLETTSTHGTGCTLSSAIAARLALGDELVEAVREAIDYLCGAIAAAFPLGQGHGPVHHFYR